MVLPLFITVSLYGRRSDQFHLSLALFLFFFFFCFRAGYRKSVCGVGASRRELMPGTLVEPRLFFTVGIGR